LICLFLASHSTKRRREGGKEGKKRKCVLWSVTSFLLFFTERKRYRMERNERLWGKGAKVEKAVSENEERPKREM